VKGIGSAEGRTLKPYGIYRCQDIVEGRNDERLLGAHVKSSHTSTKVHGRYCSAEARCALIESKTISVDVAVVVIVRQPLKKVSTPSHIPVRVQPHDNM
jgi:hypothetical protein